MTLELPWNREQIQIPPYRLVARRIPDGFTFSVRRGQNVPPVAASQSFPFYKIHVCSFMTMSVDGNPAPRTGALSRRRNQNFYPAVQVVTKRDILEKLPPRSRSSLRVINQSCIKLTGENEAVVPMFFKGPQPIPLSIGVRVTEGRTSRHRSGNEISEWQRFYSCRGLNPAAWHWEADQYLYEVRNSGWLPFQFLVVGPLWLFPSIQSKKKKRRTAALREATVEPRPHMMCTF